MEYCRFLLEFRAKHNLTQKQLAEILQVNVNMVGRYELGISEPTKVNRIKQEQKMKEWENGKNGKNVQM